jgi:glycerophosphoryl diester phosphodiesterase
MAMCATAGFTLAHADRGDQFHFFDNGHKNQEDSVQLGPRPFYLVEGMDAGKLKDRLMECKDGPFYRTDFSIGHRGAALQFPEHSDVAYMAGARMGAGIVECDVTFTKDGELVCRHSECDLATTTNIVATPLNEKCTTPWTGPVGANPAPQCCASDLTVEELKTLEAKMDASNPAATTPEGFLGGTASWRTDLYTGRAHVVTLRESIAINQQNGVKHTPELKGATYQDRIDEIFGGQEQYAQKFIDELRDAGVKPKDAWVQSFNLNDILYWIENEPAFGKQAVYLDSVDPTATPAIPRISFNELKNLKKNGVRIFAPPMWALLAVDDDEVVPSEYAKDIKKAGLDIITWTFERSDLRNGAATAGWYYQFDPDGKAIKKDSDMYKALDVLARQVKILGIFSDWPATVTYYANCEGLR